MSDGLGEVIRYQTPAGETRLGARLKQNTVLKWTK